MSDESAQPKCPECTVQGIGFIVSTESTEESGDNDPWFTVVHCKKCGYVYGVLAKYVYNRELKRLIAPLF